MLNQRFNSITEVVQSTLHLVVSERKMLESQGRQMVIDYEERMDFIMVLNDRLLKLVAMAKDRNPQ